MEQNAALLLHPTHYRISSNSPSFITSLQDPILLMGLRMLLAFCSNKDLNWIE